MGDDDVGLRLGILRRAKPLVGSADHAGRLHSAPVAGKRRIDGAGAVADARDAEGPPRLLYRVPIDAAALPGADVDSFDGRALRAHHDGLFRGARRLRRAPIENTASEEERSAGDAEEPMRAERLHGPSVRNRLRRSLINSSRSLRKTSGSCHIGETLGVGWPRKETPMAAIGKAMGPIPGTARADWARHECALPDSRGQRAATEETRTFDAPPG